MRGTTRLRVGIHVIIGASAFPAHGYDRSTQDIDLFIKPTRTNAKRAMEALQAIGYDLMDLSLENFLKKKTLLRQYILDTDIHPFVTGVTFPQVWKQRVPTVCEGVPCHCASLDDLICMKKAAGRPKDLEDLRYLEKIKARKKN